MGLYLLKEYLDYEDVADYLSDKGVYNFDLKQSYDQQKIMEVICDFVKSHKIEPVFHYFGKVDVTEEKTLSIDKVGNQTTYNTGAVDIKYNITTDDYFFINNELFYELFLNRNCDQVLNVTNQKFSTYHESGQYDCTTDETMFYHHLKDTKELNFFELRYPRYYFDMMYNNDNLNQTQIDSFTTEIDQLKARVAELEQQLKDAQLKTPTPANDDEELLSDLDSRTKNNFIRVMIALNEMAKNKQGNHLHIGEKFSGKNLEKLNIELAIQEQKTIGERGYKTLMGIINKVR